MMNLKDLKRAIDQIAAEKNIEPEAVFEAVESAIAAAYRREHGKKSEIIKAKLDLKTGDVKFWQIKIAVDETLVRMKESTDSQRSEAEQREPEKPLAAEEILHLFNPDRHILIEEARKIKPEIQLGEELEFPLEPHEDFGRIASQAAKQVILQKLRGAERESIKKEYQNKVGEIISGLVQRLERDNVFVDLGRAVGVMFYNETIPGEHYRLGERLRFYLLAVQEETKLPGLILSRSHPKFVSKLFELEVPEIHEGLVEIKAIAREAGSRTKIAAVSKIEGVDPIGSLVGQRGTRVMAVTNELNNEKIDIIEWSEDPEKFIASALSPAKISSVEILPRREARVFVPEDQLSLAIGKTGQNVRLAAKLTGWKIDVRSTSRPEEIIQEGVAETEKLTEAEEPKFEKEKEKE